MEQVDEGEVAFTDKYSPPIEGGGSPIQIAAAIELLTIAGRPAVLAGNGVFWTNAGSQLNEFIDLTQYPVRMTGLAQGVVRSDHPLCQAPQP